jgi:hypothetical protein
MEEHGQQSNSLEVSRRQNYYVPQCVSHLYPPNAGLNHQFNTAAPGTARYQFVGRTDNVTLPPERNSEEAAAKILQFPMRNCCACL